MAAESDLVERARAGDERAFEALFGHYEPALRWSLKNPRKLLVAAVLVVGSSLGASMRLLEQDSISIR